MISRGSDRGGVSGITVSQPTGGSWAPAHSAKLFRMSETTQKRAIITGITGQDGSYLAELLLSKGYEVHGFIRRSSSFNTGRIDHVYQEPHAPNHRLILHFADLADASRLVTLINEIQPDEVYNLA